MKEIHSSTYLVNIFTKFTECIKWETRICHVSKRQTAWLWRRFTKNNLTQWGSHIYNDINFDVTYDGHQNPSNVHRKFFWPILMIFTCDVKIYINVCEPHSIHMFVNFLHSLAVWLFDIWHLFDNLTSFNILTHYLNHFIPSVDIYPWFQSQGRISHLCISLPVCNGFLKFIPPVMMFYLLKKAPIQCWHSRGQQVWHQITLLLVFLSSYRKVSDANITNFVHNYRQRFYCTDYYTHHWGSNSSRRSRNKNNWWSLNLITNQSQ